MASNRALPLVAASLSLILAGPAAAQNPTAAHGRLDAWAGGPVDVRLHRATEVARFVELPPTAPRLAGSLEEQARDFLTQHGEIFGIRNAANELAAVRSYEDSYGGSHLEMVQRYQGLPVFGGSLRLHWDREGALRRVNGTFVPIRGLDSRPRWTADAATRLAIDSVRSKISAELGDLAAVATELVVFRSGLLQRIEGLDHLAWQVEVATPTLAVRRLVFVDAHSGKLLDVISLVHEALDREVSETTLGNVVWMEGDDDPIPPGWAGGTPARIAAWQNEIDGARETYNFFASMTNGAHLSYDGADAQMRTLNNDPGISCPNANWNGVSTNYCNGVTADDVVSHEWGHAYTDFTHDLIYAWQTGALNESYSDIWGESIDFLNGRGTDIPNTARSAGGCSAFGAGPADDNTYRWLLGEDATAFGGAIRDLWDPTCYGDPGKVSDGQYWCQEGDSGGVHFNSGVPNHAFALLVDGGSYNGETIGGIGLTKAAHIYWLAQAAYQTPVSDFFDHADALEASCSDLKGVNLYTLTTDSAGWGTLSGEMISAADCVEVVEAIAAVELRTPPDCGFVPILEPGSPELCSGAGSSVSVVSQNWEGGLGPWSAGDRDVANAGTFDGAPWQVVGDLPGSRPGQAAFADDPILGDCDTDDETGVRYLQSPEIDIPGPATVPRIAFDHWVASELSWDGGNLKINVNGGGWQLVPPENFTFNAYNTTLNSPPANTNPMSEEPAFSGGDGGTLSGSWGQSQVTLLGIAGPGDSVELRFELGTDACFGLIGWYVDDFDLHYCDAEPIGPTIEVSPGSVESFQGPDQVRVQGLEVKNTGNATLNWSITEAGASEGVATNGSACDSPEDVPWLSVSPSAAATPVLDASNVDLTFDSTGLGSGLYNAVLCVASDAVDEPLVEVAVTLEVPEPEVLACNGDPVTFELGIPGDWTVINDTTNGWGTTADGFCGSANLPPGNFAGTGIAACADSDADGGEMDTKLCTPPIDLSTFSSASVEFLINYQVFLTPGADDAFEVLVSTDLSSYDPALFSVNNDYPSPVVIAIPNSGSAESLSLDAYAGETIHVCFRYSGDFDWYAHVDDVGLTCVEGPGGPGIFEDGCESGDTSSWSTTVP